MSETALVIKAAIYAGIIGWLAVQKWRGWRGLAYLAAIVIAVNAFANAVDSFIQ